MGQAPRSVSQNPFGAVLPSDLTGAAVERLNDIVMVTEVEPIEEPGMRVLFVNPAFERITGYRADEILGRSPRFLQGPGSASPETDRLDAALRAREPARVEILNYRKDGSPLWLEIEASTMRSPTTDAEFFVFIERDVTERKKLDAALRERERSIAVLFKNLPGMAYRCRNDAFWTMDFVSEGCLELTGYDPSELIANRKTSFEAIIHPDDRATVRTFDGTTREGDGAFELTYRIITKVGGVKWVHERGRSVALREGSLRHFEGFISDVTERKLLEAQVVQGQRIESIGTLAGGIAHDLNNVFAPIMMAGELLTERITEKDSSQLLRAVTTSAKRGAELVRQILLFARGMEGPRVTVDPAALLGDIRAFLESTFPKSIRLDFHIPPGMEAISGDPTQLHQLLLNLSVNARDAMPSGGTLSIHAQAASVSPSAPRPHPDAVPGDFVRIDVGDTGTGIPNIVRSQIFDPFFTTKGVGGGSGLGLSTARSIAKAHRGFITFVSTEGAGTTFSVYLPTANSGLTRAVRDPEAPGEAPPRRGSGEHILVVDDEESVRFIMSSSLESFGFRVSTARDGEGAVELAGSPGTRFSLFVVDMQMPGMDGGATIAALRALHPGIPIVAASGFATERSQEEAAKHGIQHFLEKPFSVEALIRTVHAAMAKAGV